MDRIELIKSLCYEGNVENTGVFETGDNPCDECSATFGTGYSQMLIDGLLKPNTQYVYVYNYRLTHPQRGEQGADVVVRASEDAVEDIIYLYEIE
jgi:hypothetical protein